MKITVTKEDIAQGIASSTEMCPVALAIKKATDIRPVRVGTFTVLMGSWSNPIFEGSLPEKVTDFICDLVRGKDVAPFSFELDIEKD